MSIETLRYEGNRKHKEPWQPGRKGSLCPREIDAEVASALLEQSELEEGKRYAVYDGVAYVAQEHAPSAWHGYPVPWMEVPDSLRRRWTRGRLVSRQQVKKFWRETP